jgi:membrane protein
MGEGSGRIGIAATHVRSAERTRPRAAPASARQIEGMQLPRQLDFPKRVVQQSLDDEVPDLAAGLAYRFLFAIFPFAIFLAALAAFLAQWFGVGDPTNDILSALKDNLPPGVADQIAPQLEAVLGQSRPGLLSVGAILALWAATGGISSLMNAMNKAYDVPETRNFFVKIAIAIGLTIVGSAGILVAFVTIVGGSVITEQAIQTLGVAPGTWSAIALLRFPLVLVMVALAVAVLFRYGPNVGVSFRWTAIGGLVFAIGWLVATVVFGLYVANFGSYANTYGALGGVVVLMLWFYITAILLLVAAEVTSLLAKDREPERLHQRRLETDASEEAGRIKERAARRAGVAAGALKGAAESVVDGDSPREPRPQAPREAPVTRIPRVTADAGPRTTFQPSRLFALAVLAAGAAAGALAGILASDDDEDAASG